MPLIPSRRITWQVVAGVIDGPDSDQEPDIIPAIGEVFFDFSIPYVTVPDASPNPVTMLTMTFRGVFDSEGYLCTPDPVNPDVPGYRGVRIYVNDDPGLATTGWTVTVRPRFAVVNGSTPSIPAFSIAVVHGTEDLDLTRVVKVPSSPGVGVPEALALVERAEAAATAAASVRADADAGLFDGPQGPPGNATIRVSETAGRAAYYTKPGTTTEQLFYGDTGWRDISTLLVNGWTGAIRIRRTGYDVKLQITQISAAAATSGTFVIAPVGFQLGITSIGNFRGFVFQNSAPITMRGVNIASTAAVAITQYAATDNAVLGTFEWSTNEPWPTSLPGTAVGTIPNL